MLWNVDGDIYTALLAASSSYQTTRLALSLWDRHNLYTLVMDVLNDRYLFTEARRKQVRCREFHSTPKKNGRR